MVKRVKKTLFKKLKKIFITKLNLPIVVEIDILDFILGVYLVQKHLNRWHLVIYYSCKITPLKLNYNIYNKKLLGIIAALKKWKAFL